MSIHLKTALDSIKRSPFQAVAAIFVLSLTFFVATILAVLVFSTSRLLTYFETRPQVIAFLKDDVSTQDIAAFQKKLAADSRIKEVRYVTKEDALAIYKEATADNPLLGELVNPSIFPASLEFSLVDLKYAEEVIAQVKNEPIVGQVGFTASLGGQNSLQDVVARLRSITWYLRVGGGVFVGLLGATSFLVLLIIISMRMATRKGEIEILNLIGATPGFIRSPIMIEAMIYSVTGVVLGWTLALILTLYATPNIIGYFGQIPVLPRQTIDLFALFGVFLVAELFLGLLLSLMGSWLAISRVRLNR